MIPATSVNAIAAVTVKETRCLRANFRKRYVRLGGPASIVGDPRLCYGDVEDAVRKIDAILRDEALQRELSGGVRCRSEEFSARRFMDEFRTVVEDFAGARLERTDA